MQAHIIGVVMDITAFKVSHSSGIDIDATALRAARMRSSPIGALVWIRMSQKVQRTNRVHPSSSQEGQCSSCNIQPNQLGSPARFYRKGPPP